MLFDLRGRGRRRSVQAIYVVLALLLGLGLIGFGIGSNSSGGGIFDALKGGGGGNNNRDKELDKELTRAVAKVKASPSSPAAVANLTNLRVQRANLESDATKAVPRFQLASTSWDQYLALNPKNPDAGLASLMVRVYSTGLAQPKKAAQAMEVVTAQTKPPRAGLYRQLAELSYLAGDNRTGDLAADRAVELAKPSERKALRAYLDQRKSAGTAQQQAQQTQPSG
ncbi:MAG: hypothetical protein QOG15_2082 [Solirubrobacteraceae bacterium]|jgi:hypothetical protein|nr:hypothetical protein [Solirubrobacteraceae bacterium]